MVSKVINAATNFRYSCCFTKLPACTKCDGCESCTASNESIVCATDIKQEVFEEGETLFYTKKGWSGLVNVKSIFIDNDYVLRFIMTDSNYEEIIITRGYLRSLSNPGVGWIPIMVPEYNPTAHYLTD